MYTHCYIDCQGVIGYIFSWDVIHKRVKDPDDASERSSAHEPPPSTSSPERVSSLTSPSPHRMLLRTYTNTCSLPHYEHRIYVEKVLYYRQSMYGCKEPLTDTYYMNQLPTQPMELLSRCAQCFKDTLRNYKKGN